MADDPLRRLLDAAVEGDDRALAELVRLTQPAVWRLCASLGSPGREDDLTQDTYLRAIRSLAGYRGDGSVLSWLLSIARRTCADDVRRRRRERRLGSRLALVRFDDPPAPTAVDELLAGLDPDRREAFVLTQVVGLAYAEAAEVIGCPIGTVRSRVARARADLAAAVRAADAG
ncbi:MAG: RNA polymerase sigma factor [Acidimicrobiia bacterium]